jgi:hypothetical protein
VHGIGSVQDVLEDDITVLIKFGAGAKINETKQIVNGLYEKLKPALVGNHLGERVRHREYGLGTVTSWAGNLVVVNWDGKKGAGVNVPQEDLKAP